MKSDEKGLTAAQKVQYRAKLEVRIDYERCAKRLLPHLPLDEAMEELGWRETVGRKKRWFRRVED